MVRLGIRLWWGEMETARRSSPSTGAGSRLGCRSKTLPGAGTAAAVGAGAGGGAGAALLVPSVALPCGGGAGGGALVGGGGGKLRLAHQKSLRQG